MKSRLGDKTRIRHINDSLGEIKNYTMGVSYEEFKSNSMMQYAAVKQLEIIGEAVNHLSKEFKDIHKNIQWHEITGLRNMLIHEYFGIDVKIVWDIIKKDVPDLHIKIKEIIQNI